MSAREDLGLAPKTMTPAEFESWAEGFSAKVREGREGWIASHANVEIVSTAHDPDGQRLLPKPD